MNYHVFQVYSWRLVMKSLESIFGVRRRGGTVGREILGGVSTFMALSYIIFVQPAVLGGCATGPMDKSAVMFATCVCSAIGCLIMGLWANLPIATAPAMGHNFFFAFTVCGTAAMGGMGFTWQEALAANFLGGFVFLALSAFGFREAIINAIPEGLKFAIAAGIGLLIAFIGLQWSGVIVGHPETHVTIGRLINPITLLSLFGLMLIALLIALNLRGAIMVGMFLTAAVGYAASRLWGHQWGYVLVNDIAQFRFPSPAATFGAVFSGFGPLFERKASVIVLAVFTFLLLDLFDTIGTLVGLAERGGLMVNGRIPNARRALMADAVSTMAGTVVGTSTICAYIESGAGIAAGARTGLASVVTAVLLLASVFAYSLVEVIGNAVVVPAAALGSLTGKSVACYPVVAPVLIIIGCYMLPVVRRIDWDDFTEALPAFLTIVVMQFALSITDGIAWGFITYALLKLLTGKAKQCTAIVYICAGLFVLYYVFRH
jgi:adenine/guanine/hypoxanthine permease